MFADDVILFSQASPDQVDCIREGLESLYDASGQIINFHKSLFYFSPNLLDQLTTHMSLRLGIRSSKDLGVYLGHQLIHHCNSSRVFDGLFHKVKHQLHGWKAKCLSRAGRITLAQTVLNTVFIYHMQVQRLPATVHKALDKYVCQCVWGSSDEKHTMHHVS